MNKNEYGVIQLPSGLFQGIVGKDLCFIVRNFPQEAMNDAEELFKRLNAE